MRTYLNRVAGVLNAALLVSAAVILTNVNITDAKDLLFAMLLVITPAFTLFALFAPHGQ
jgi:hypothetical protein